MKDMEFDNEQYPQKWELIEMTGNIQNSVIRGANMPYQEFYLFDANDTFIKHRQQNGLVIEVSGSFSFEEDSDGKSLQLNYKTDNKIIGSCEERTERLRIKSDRLFNSWNMCDGPGLTYKRIE
jgi:hypothetical protein